MEQEQEQGVAVSGVRSSDWLAGQPPRDSDTEFVVKLKDGSVRKCRRTNRVMSGWIYTDCTHPAQNCIAHMWNVEAWMPANDGS